VAPNYWLNPQTGVQYLMAVQTPQYHIDSIDALQSIPIMTSALSTPQLLSNLATVERRTAQAVMNHHNVQPVFDIYANVQGRDLGGVARDVDQVIAEFQPKLPAGSSLVVRGQVQSMRAAFSGLGAGVVFAIILVYFLLVINFQSWLDPLIIIMALPGALAGIAWMLFVTGTTISVPALMGAMMSIGVATANSILLITFANDQRREGQDAIAAALSAGYTRLRPVLMTALAMIIGMLPMALGLGEGGEQNAPLGRAVIGGLAVATLATLFFVPVTYSLLRRQQLRHIEANTAELAPAPPASQEVS
jgi:multidrug efflux pump subunit AcrB